MLRKDSARLDIISQCFTRCILCQRKIFAVALKNITDAGEMNTVNIHKRFINRNIAGGYIFFNKKLAAVFILRQLGTVADYFKR